MVSDDPGRVTRLLLVGFMGSGKSTVGPELAGLLGWTFLDIDDIVAEAVGLPVSAIFTEHGEAFFRAREHETTLGLLARESVVLASGGGWPAAPGRLEGLGVDTASVWLDVPMAELLARLERTAGGRPLLEGPDRDRRLRELLERRAPFYGKATRTVDGRGAPGEVVRRVLAALPGLAVEGR